MEKQWIKKFCVWVAGITILIMIIFPVITNTLMFINGPPVAGDAKTWIGFLGSFGGAIIGGVISGTLTLLGVKLTIDREKSRINKEKDNASRYIYSEIHHRIIALDTAFKSIARKELNDEIQQILICAKKLKVESGKLFGSAAAVDIQILYALKNLSWHSKEIINLIEGGQREGANPEQIAYYLENNLHPKISQGDAEFDLACTKYRK